MKLSSKKTIAREIALTMDYFRRLERRSNPEIAEEPLLKLVVSEGVALSEPRVTAHQASEHLSSRLRSVLRPAGSRLSGLLRLLRR